MAEALIYVSRSFGAKQSRRTSYDERLKDPILYKPQLHHLLNAEIEYQGTRLVCHQRCVKFFDSFMPGFHILATCHRVRCDDTHLFYERKILRSIFAKSASDNISRPQCRGHPSANRAPKNARIIGRSWSLVFIIGTIFLLLRKWHKHFRIFAKATYIYMISSFF